MRISPFVGGSKPASIIRQVVFPDPGRPEQGQELAPHKIELKVLHNPAGLAVAFVNTTELNVRNRVVHDFLSGYSRDLTLAALPSAIV